MDYNQGYNNEINTGDDDKQETYLGTSKLSTAGTTTIPAKVRSKAFMKPEDEISYFVNSDGDIIIRNLSRKDLITPGTDYLVKAIDEIISSDYRVIFFSGNSMPYYPPAIMAAYVQITMGEFMGGAIEFTDEVESTYEKYIKGDTQSFNSWTIPHEEDKKLYREVTRYKSNDKDITMYLINAMSNSSEISKEVPKILENTNAKIVILSINNHHESSLNQVKNLEKYIRITYNAHTPLKVEEVDLIKNKINEIQY